MHEFSIVQAMLDRALAEAEKNEAKRICEMSVKLGKASHITPESLELCFRAVAKGTIAENATLDVHPIELTARCRTCNCTFPVKDEVMTCPSCGGGNTQLVNGDEVYLESVVID